MLLTHSTTETILAAVQNLYVKDDELVVLFIAEHVDCDIEILLDALNNLNINFLGGIFPSILGNNTHYTNAVLVKKWKLSAPPVLVTGLDTRHFSLSEITNITTSPYANGLQTALILVDGLTRHISDFLSEFYNIASNTVNCIGGGAGSLSLRQSPCIFTKDGMFQDAAVVAFLDTQCSIGVNHGWKRISMPIVCTKAQRNVIQNLNWHNAFEVYKKVIAAYGNGQQLTATDFFAVAKGFPFGIFKENAEDVVRDPIAVTETGDLVCVGEVPENTVLYVLQGETEALLQAAANAALTSISQTNGTIYDVLVIDCISRVLFLQDDFGREVAAIQHRFSHLTPQPAAEGVLTLGEIASVGKGLLEFFNKTTVVGSFCA